MIFGKTVEQVAKEESQKAKRVIFGDKMFAWMPVVLTDGRKVWLSSYYEYLNGKFRDGIYESHGQYRRYLERSLNLVNLVNYRYEKVVDEELEKMMNDQV